MFQIERNLQLVIHGGDHGNGQPSHHLTFAYPNQPTSLDKTHMKQYFEHLSALLPCAVCRIHFDVLLKEYPIDSALASRQELTKWLVEIHNRVNDRLGKPRLGYDYVSKQYQSWNQLESCPNAPSQPETSKKCSSRNGMFGRVLGILFIVTLIVLSFLLYHCFLRNGITSKQNSSVDIT